MTNKNRLEFTTHDEWHAYVDLYVPLSERAHALAAGRTELLKHFYELRNWQLPSEFSMELDRIHERGQLDSPTDLERLNERILGHLTVLLLNCRCESAPGSDSNVVRDPRERVRELRDYIANANPYFRLWVQFKSRTGSTNGPSWDEYLLQFLGSSDGEVFEFAQAMAELDKLLDFYSKANLSLPRFSFERVWFLHCLRPPERMLQTRSVLTLLTAEIEACTSA